MDFIWSCALSRFEAGGRSCKHHMGEMLLEQLDRVAAVRPFGECRGLDCRNVFTRRPSPDLDRWAQQFAQVANGGYDFREVEASVNASECAERALWTNHPLDRSTGTAEPAVAEELRPTRASLRSQARQEVVKWLRHHWI
jgi:hypothetical protein